MNAEMQNAEFKKTSGCWLLASGSIRNFFQLIRFKVSLAITFSAFAAEVICSGHIHIYLLFPALGIFLLASGASAASLLLLSAIDRQGDSLILQLLSSISLFSCWLFSNFSFQDPSVTGYFSHR